VEVRAKISKLRFDENLIKLLNAIGQLHVGENVADEPSLMLDEER
jgi:hypothetical protein